MSFVTTNTTTTTTDSSSIVGTNNSSIVYNNNNNNSSSSSNNDSLDLDQYIFNRWAVMDGENTTTAIAVPILFSVIFVVGLVGNGTLIVSVVANKVMRNVPNILIVSLSLGDFLLVLLSIPMTSTYYTFKSWPYGLVACKLNEFMHTTSLGISVFSLMALSADRYVAINDPMAKLKGRTTRLTVLLAAGIWFLSMLCAAPDAVFSNLRDVHYGGERFLYCTPFPVENELMYESVYVIVRLIVFFLLPIHTIAFFYITMARILIRSSESVPMEMKNGAAGNCRQIAARKKVAYVVLSFVILFVICWLPRYVYLMVATFGNFYYNEAFHVFKIFGFCLKFVNSCINPIACYVLSGHFRKYFNRYLFCCCRRRRYAILEGNRGQSQALNSTTRRGSPTSMSAVHTQSNF